MTKQAGYSLPLSPRGTASLVPAPPWHYVGDFLVIEYWADPAAVAAVLPEGLEPHPTIRAAARRSSSTGSRARTTGDELVDPVRGQYKEFFIVVNALLDGEPVTTCPYIWVDKDFALVRGWIQGFPKKLGEIEMTRSFGLDWPGRAAAPSPAPSRPTAAGWREALVTPERESRDRPDPQRSAADQRAPLPAPGRRASRRSGGARAGPRASAATARSRRSGRAAATLELSPAPGEEHTALAPVADRARASASRSPTRSTTSRRCATL